MMKITAIKVYKSLGCPMSMVPITGVGNVIEVAMASVVLIETDAGISGVGEFTPAAENYIEGHSEGVRQRYG